MQVSMIEGEQVNSKQSTDARVDPDRLRQVRHLALDMDGTLYLGGTLFGFTLDFLSSLREMGIGYTFFTNNSSKSTQEYIERLGKMGIEATLDMFYSSTHATIDYIRKSYPMVKRLYALGTTSFQEELVEYGFEISAAQPDMVVVGYDTELTYAKLCRAAYWIKQGKPYVATHPDLICPTDRAIVLPDCGAICKMLAAATDRNPDAILGKPNVQMLKGLLDRHDLEPSQVAMLGDRLYTDIAMANNAGALSVLVLTGETKAEDVAGSAHQPDITVDNAWKFFEILRGSLAGVNVTQPSPESIKPVTKPSGDERTTSDHDDVDVLIIGGGIVGAGIARDAAMRGLRVGLVEQNDFSSGTSSRSSRLLHGGLRYLAQGRIGLVREASLEKQVVQKIAPHLAESLPFIFPTYKGTQWKRWKLGIGVKIYDLLCNGRNFGKSQTLGVDRVRADLQGINADDLTGAVRYFDGLTNDARLVIDTLRSAESHGARLHNYTRFENASDKGGVWQCELHDRRANRHYNLHAKTVVNASGPWADRLAHSRTSLRLTKGVHLVIDRDRLPIPDAVVMTEGDRILFAIPWGKRVILGTTDTDYDGPLDSPTCDPEDVQYVLAITNKTFSEASLQSEHVIAKWAGIRPLIANGDEAGTPSDTSRSHQIRMTEPGWFDVAGGKLTTYRLMAEQTVDMVVNQLGCEALDCQTAKHRLLNPGEERGSGILPPAVTRDQVVHYCQNEWAIHLDDVMLRRSSWTYYHSNAIDIAQRVAAWMADIYQWDQSTTAAELQRYIANSGDNKSDSIQDVAITSTPNVFLRSVLKGQPQQIEM